MENNNKITQLAFWWPSCQISVVCYFLSSRPSVLTTPVVASQKHNVVKSLFIYIQTFATNYLQSILFILCSWNCDWFLWLKKSVCAAVDLKCGTDKHMWFLNKHHTVDNRIYEAWPFLVVDGPSRWTIAFIMIICPWEKKRVFNSAVDHFWTTGDYIERESPEYSSIHGVFLNTESHLFTFRTIHTSTQRASASSTGLSRFIRTNKTFHFWGQQGLLPCCPAFI